MKVEEIEPDTWQVDRRCSSPGKPRQTRTWSPSQQCTRIPSHLRDGTCKTTPHRRQIVHFQPWGTWSQPFRGPGLFWPKPEWRQGRGQRLSNPRLRWRGCSWWPRECRLLHAPDRWWWSRTRRKQRSRRSPARGRGERGRRGFLPPGGGTWESFLFGSKRLRKTLRLRVETFWSAKWNRSQRRWKESVNRDEEARRQ